MARIRVRATINKLSARGRACARILPPRQLLLFSLMKSRFYQENRDIWLKTVIRFGRILPVTDQSNRQSSARLFAGIPAALFRSKGETMLSVKVTGLHRIFVKKESSHRFFFSLLCLRIPLAQYRNFYVRGLSYYRLKSTNITSVNMLERMRWQWN